MRSIVNTVSIPEILMKKCSFCAEKIQNDAIKYRFYGEFIINESEREKRLELKKKGAKKLLFKTVKNAPVGDSMYSTGIQ